MLNDFNIRIEFAPDGEVEHAYYWDQEGCGHERAFNLTTDLDDVIAYHLKHMRESHRLTPIPMCQYVIAITDDHGDKRQVRCIREVHTDGLKHRFEI